MWFVSDLKITNIKGAWHSSHFELSSWDKHLTTKPIYLEISVKINQKLHMQKIETFHMSSTVHTVQTYKRMYVHSSI